MSGNAREEWGLLCLRDGECGLWLSLAGVFAFSVLLFSLAWFLGESRAFWDFVLVLQVLCASLFPRST